MNEFALKVVPKNQGTIIDMCGTGGDRLQTFNISTTASFVVAAAGGIVAKHGNRSSSGVSGSADIFEYFGYDLNQSPSQISDILEKHDICFMFAQKFHPAMKHVSAARKQIGARTAFNLLGPLSNPAGVKNQLVGVFSIEYLERLPLIMKRKGIENIMNNDEQSACAFVKRLTTWDSGGGMAMDIVELQDGQVLGITEDSVVLYQNMDDLEQGEIAERPVFFL